MVVKSLTQKSNSAAYYTAKAFVKRKGCHRNLTNSVSKPLVLSVDSVELTVDYTGYNYSSGIVQRLQRNYMTKKTSNWHKCDIDEYPFISLDYD